MRIFPTIPIGLALAGLGACGGGDTPTVAIDARPISREVARGESVAAVESGHHTIEVRRTIRIPDPCRTLAGDLVEVAGALTLRIVAVPDGRSCPPGESYLAYTARIEGLPPGRYELRVVHAPLRTRGRAEVALEHPVLVMESSVQVR